MSRSRRTRTLTFVSSLAAAASICAQDHVEVADATSFRDALANAKPGTQIVLAKDAVIEGGIHAADVRGALGDRIVIRSADPEHPAVLRGGRSGLHLSNVAWLEIRDLVIEKSEVNGLNLDDGGPESETRAEGILIERLQVRRVGSDGNHDAIKLSGLKGFRVLDCRIEQWGDGGSGIDLVGCRDGEIDGCTLVHRRNKGASGIQIKGGSRDVAVRRCRLEHAGARALHLGGSTGREFFRPDPDNEATERFEAKDLLVEGCTIIGSEAALAFVGVDGAEVRMNTIYRPERWVLRILQESKQDFVPCRGGSMTRNLIVLDREALRRGVNIGPDTDPESFSFESNAWWCEEASTKSGLHLPTEERRPVHGRQPRFVDEEALDLTQHARSPLRKFGADAASS